jgi:hypothetical protein
MSLSIAALRVRQVVSAVLAPRRAADKCADKRHRAPGIDARLAVELSARML